MKLIKVTLLTAICLVIFGLILPGLASAEQILVEDFDSYSTGSLDGINGWSTVGSTVVQNSISQSAPNAIDGSSSVSSLTKEVNVTTGDTLSFFIYPKGDLSFEALLGDTSFASIGGSGRYLLYYSTNNSDFIDIYYNSSVNINGRVLLFENVPKLQWHEIVIDFTKVDGSGSFYDITLNGSETIEDIPVELISPGDFTHNLRSGSGNHNVIIDSIGSGTSGQDIPGLIFNETKITDVAVSGSAATTTIDIDYFIDTNGYTPVNRPDYIIIRVTDSELELVSQTNNIILPLNNGSASTTRVINESLSDGTYYGDAVFWNINTNAPAGYNGGVFEFEIISGSITNSEYDAYETDTFNEGDVTIQQQPCGITNISGCIVNAVSFLFIPNDRFLQQFPEQWESLQTVKPFGYVFQVFDLRGDLSTTTPDTNLPSLPFTSTIFEPLRAGIAVILWAAFLFYLYNRFKSISV